MATSKYTTRFLFLILLEVLPLAKLYAQLVQLPNSELITEKNGLPFNIGSCLIQDKLGFIWISSLDGLARYDGYSFITLQHKPAAPNSLPNNSIAILTIDPRGPIWAGHIGGYVSKIDPLTFDVWHTKIEGAEESTVNTIFCDSKGVVWCSVSGKGLYRQNSNGVFRHVRSLTDLPKNSRAPAAAYNTITNFYELDNYTFCLTTPNGLYKFIPADSTLRHLSSLGSPDDPASVIQMVSDHKGGFWCATWGKGLVYYNLDQNTYKGYLFEEGHKSTYNVIYNLIQKSPNEIWGGTGAMGVIVFNTDTKKFTFTHDAADPTTAFACGEMLKDRSGTIWALSDRGLHKWSGTENHFMFYKVNVTHDDNHNYYGVTSILNDQKNKRTVIATIYGDGVHVFNADGNEKILPIPLLPNAEPFNVVLHILQDHAGNTYVLTRDFLLLLTPDNQLKKVNEINSLLPQSTIPFFYRMIQSKNGDLWVLSSRNGLFHMSAATKKWEYLPTQAPYPKVDNKAYRIVEDKSGKIWIMHSRIGLTVYDPIKKTWVNYKHENNNPTSLISNIISGLTMTPEGEIYVSTYEGISKFNPENNSFENHTISSGLPTQTFYSMDSDNGGMLWLSSNKGIVRIDPAKWTSQIFSYKDGLKGSYANLTVQKGDHGKMYITTHRGFYVFDPAEIKDAKTVDAPVMITSVKNLSSNTTNYNPSATLQVDYKHNSLAIEFAALNYYNPLHNRYRYKIENLDKEWIETTDHSVNYSGVPSGTYTFEVQLIGSDSKASQASIKILVSTPFWNQDWFRMLLATAALGIVYSGYRFRLNQVRKQEKLKREYSKRLAEVEMKALKAQMNPHFIFNSLNSINRYIVKSEPEKASLYLTKFSKLIRLILDNSNHKIISLENELNALKLYIELEALRFNEKFSYSIQLNNQLNPMSVGVPPMIIQPFVENAIWHGLLHKEESGKLEIQVERYGSGLRCVITDNGVGRKKAKELNSKSVNKEKSYGMKITNDRLSMLNGDSQISTVEIVDLEDDQGNALGTKVIVKILSAELEPEF